MFSWEKTYYLFKEARVTQQKSKLKLLLLILHLRPSGHIDIAAHTKALGQRQRG